MAKWKVLLASRKFWAAVVGLAVLLVKTWYPDFPLEPDILSRLMTLIMAYIMGVAVEDGLKARSGGGA